MCTEYNKLLPLQSESWVSTSVWLMSPSENAECASVVFVVCFCFELTSPQFDNCRLKPITTQQTHDCSFYTLLTFWQHRGFCAQVYEKIYSEHHYLTQQPHFIQVFFLFFFCVQIFYLSWHLHSHIFSYRSLTYTEQCQSGNMH